MRMNSILLLSVLFVQMFSSCNDNENETNIPVVEKEVSYPHRYYIDPENGAYYNTGHSPLCKIHKTGLACQISCIGNSRHRYRGCGARGNSWRLYSAGRSDHESRQRERDTLAGLRGDVFELFLFLKRISRAD